ncbi:MAG: hypothetical protein JNL17_05120 [Cyclobacteriaceae bacterium]|nr:hypothetical protein [Cyclobacteriaceae bacterium]
MNCPNCKSPYGETDATCIICGFPFQGTDAEKSKFIGQQVLKEGVIDESRKATQNARLILFFIGGLNCILALFIPDLTTKVIALALGFLYVTFGLLIKKSPKLIMSFALFLLLLVFLIEGIIEPISLFRGIVWKLLYISSLVYGLYNVSKAEKLRLESEYLKQK